MIPCSSTSSSRAWNSSLVIDLRSSGYDTAGNLTEHGRALQSAAMIVDVDHVILAVSRADHAHFSDRLRGSGFVHADAGRHVGQGTANENLALAGGQYLELLFPDPPPDPPRGWYEPAPHILGLCLRSTDVDADASVWAGSEGAWTQRLEKTLDDDTDVVFKLAGPHERDDASFFVFLLERAEPAFPELGAAARLERVRLRGADAPRWRDAFGHWLGIEASGGSASVGEAKLRFEEDSRLGLIVDVEFAVPTAEGDLRWPAATSLCAAGESREFTEEWVLAEARRQYDEGRAQIDVDPGRTALLVVDMIDEFVRPQWCPYWVPDATRQVPAIRRLIDVFHEASLPVVYTAYELGWAG